MTRVSIVGGAGYVGGELLRLLLDHPQVEVGQVTSASRAGTFVPFAHPHLRGRTALRFTTPEGLEPCDALLLALPHGSSATEIDRFAELAPRLVDLAADFRLRDAADYARWYGTPHPRPQWLGRFVYGLPELERAAIRGARWVSGVGCNAAAVVLALAPLVRSGLLEEGRDVVCEVKVGSSEGGAQPSAASHHPERSGALRSFAPTGHRHTAEVAQALGRLAAAPPPPVHLSLTAVERVRGVLATAQAFIRPGVGEREVWDAYRDAYRDEPFVRLVKESRGLYRYPEPKILSGSNHVEVGFALDPESRRLVALAALDNLVKGAAGNAVQCLNLMQGWEETAGLGFPGLHPI